MATINVVNDVDIDGFHFLDGFPGVGIVAKIAADHLIDKLDMDLYAEVHSDDLPPIALFHSDKREITPSMRLFVDTEHELLVMRSGTPISAASEHFLETLLDWIDDHNLTPIYQAGLPLDVDEKENYLFGVGTGSMQDALADEGIEAPPVDGGIAGPVGALLSKSLERGLDAAALVVESDPNFPDPDAARAIIDDGIKPLTGIEVETDELHESAENIKQQKQEMIDQLQQMQQEHSTEAYPREMYK